MTAYRFCRTDDMGRLVEAHNHCWLPHHPGEPPLTLPQFKRLVREQQLWCSSCLIAYEGEEPVGYLFGCKRASETLLQSFAVHPAHLRRGHGRHLLTSISSKLAILGPPRLVAEVPAEAEAALGLLDACGYELDATLVDYVRPAGPALEFGGKPGYLFIPMTAAELQANGLLKDRPQPLSRHEHEPPGNPPWERATPTLLALGDRLAGTALVREERILGAILYIGSSSGGAAGAPGAGRDDGDATGRILRLDAIDDPEVPAPAIGIGLLKWLLARHPGRWIFPRAVAGEMATCSLNEMGFESAGLFRRMAARARPA